MSEAIEWILFGTVSAVAILVGVHRYRPARTGPWLLLGGAVGTLAAGDVFYATGESTGADLCYYAMFVLVVSSMLQFTRSGAILVDRARLIDILAFACATMLVVWVFVIGDGGQLGRISAADVIGDLLMVGVGARLTLASRGNRSAALLTLGAVGMLIGDVTYPLAPGPLTESGYVVLYLAWGAAALHPSMARLTEPMPARTAPWRGRSAVLLAVSVATPPLVLMIEAVTGSVRDGVVIAVAGGLTLMLTFTRLADSVAQSSQALTRERGLREATAALVSAADLPAVDEAVRAAIGQLMPAQAVRRIIFATDDRQLALEALPSGDADRSARSWWAPGPHSDEATLICPLWLEPLAVARPSGGALALVGRLDMLAATRDALEVLAGQAALALDRISLVEAVGRRDSDLYLRAVIRNTADIMLVIDEDQRVRYASPALRTLIGMHELPPLATLSDLVQSDDRVQVRQALLNQGDGVVYCALQRPDGTHVLVEATYRDLREDRLVQGFVVTMRDVTNRYVPDEQQPAVEHVDELPAWVNRRSAQHKFRY
ncbi:PAS domain S-box protein [Jidongwangia harbinensis]|uniref:PAS domain S-box protein n=1 Tax=Jidongwangia harbinensis TaxID=2878561 RepID=UPI001CDA53D9|nr:PAS domain S-box protein [Jidongwangia harbinensis]MCA2217862.1 PAS domain S-box protein [Jidongwangia harbinensis]